jgi:hypothetical protein
MRCPHCHSTIDYSPDLGSDPTRRNPDGELVWPMWAIKLACAVLFFVFLVGAFSLHAAAVGR